MAAAADLLLRVTGDTSNATAQLEKLGQQVFGLGKKASVAAVGATAAVGAFAAASVIKFASFEKSMNEVFTLLPGISGDAMGKMSDQVLALSKDLGVLPDEVVPALYQALSAGVPADNVFAFLETSVKTGIAGVTDTETAVDGLTTVINAWGLETGDASKIADTFFTGMRLGKTTVGELASSIGNVAPIAADLGVSFEEVTAATATLTSKGQATGEAMTGLRGAMVAMVRPNAEMTKALEALGFESGRAMIEQLTLAGAMDALRGFTDSTGIEMVKLTGRVEGANAILSLTGDNASDAAASLAAMEDGTGAAEAAFEQMDQGLARSWDRIKATLEVAMIEMGDDIAEFAEAVVPLLVEAADAVGLLSKAFQAAIGPIETYQIAAGEAEKETSFFEEGAARLSIALRVAGGILGRVAADRIDQWVGATEDATGQQEAFIDSLKDFVDPAEAMRDHLFDLERGLGNTDEAVGLIGETLIDTSLNLDEFGKTFENVGKAAAAQARNLREVVGGHVEGMLNIFKGAPEQIEASVDEMIANLLAIRDAARDFERVMAELIAAGFTELAAELDRQGPAATAAFAQFLDDPMAAFEANMILAEITDDELDAVDARIEAWRSPIARTAMLLGRDFVGGITDGLGGLEARMFSSIERGVSRAISSTRRRFRMESPSLVMMQEVGIPLAEGITRPIEDLLDGLPPTITDGLAEIVAAAGRGLGNLTATLRVFEGHITITLSNVRGEIQKTITAFGNIGTAGGAIPGPNIGPGGVTLPGTPGDPSLLAQPPDTSRQRALLRGIEDLLALGPVFGVSQTQAPFPLGKFIAEQLRGAINAIGLGPINLGAIDTFADVQAALGTVRTFLSGIANQITGLSDTDVDTLIFAMNSFFPSLGMPIIHAQHGAKAKAGQPFLIGEAGPEVFIPSMAGNITPLRPMGGDGGPTTIVVNLDGDEIGRRMVPKIRRRFLELDLDNAGFGLRT